MTEFDLNVTHRGEEAVVHCHDADRLSLMIDWATLLTVAHVPVGEPATLEITRTDGGWTEAAAPRVSWDPRTAAPVSINKQPQQEAPNA